MMETISFLSVFTTVAQAAGNTQLEQQQLMVGRLVLSLLLMYTLVSTVVYLSMFKIFRRAGYSGWLVLVPGYNLWLTYQIAGWPGKRSLLMLIPVYNWIEPFFLANRLARCFNRPPWFGVALVLVPVIAFPVMALNENKYDYDPPAAKD